MLMRLAAVPAPVDPAEGSVPIEGNDELARVELLHDATTDAGQIVRAGSIGTVVGVWAGRRAYEVEFPGAVEGLATVEPGLLRKV